MKLTAKFTTLLVAAFAFCILIIPQAALAAPVQNGWYTTSTGEKQYYIDGYQAIYFHNINGKYYFFDDENHYNAATGMVHIGHRWYKGFDARPNVGIPEIAFQTKSPWWCYFNKDGSAHVGWLTLGSKYSPETYYIVQDFLHSLPALAMGWQKIDGNWYFFNQTNQPINNRWYYEKRGEEHLIDRYGGSVANLADEDYRLAAMRKGWAFDLGDWYYLDKQSGKMRTGWIKDAHTWYLLSSSGSMLTGWQKQAGEWYYLKPSSGGMYENAWVKTNGMWYYLGASGAMKANSWVWSNGSWYYLGSNGAMKANTWIKDKGKWYYLNSSGAWSK